MPPLKSINCNPRFSRWREKLDDAPHFGALIKGNETKCNTIQATMDAKMRDTDVLFNTHFSSEMIAIAMVKAETDTNERMRVDRAGMKAVMDYEARRAKTDEERDMIEDVSQRDSGYDVKGPGRMIEVKSFSSTGQPMLTSHEWSSARKHGDVYWLYVVEDALDETKSPEEKITAVPDPYRNLADMVVPVSETTTKYRVGKWASVKKRFKTDRSLWLMGHGITTKTHKN